MTTKDILDKDGVRLPIKIDSTSNGEYEPIPISKEIEKETNLPWSGQQKMRKVRVKPEGSF